MLEAAGLPVAIINKVLEGRPHVVDALKNGEIHLVFNTTDGAQALADSLVHPPRGADPESSLLHHHGGGGGGTQASGLRTGSLEVRRAIQGATQAIAALREAPLKSPPSSPTLCDAPLIFFRNCQRISVS